MQGSLEAGSLRFGGANWRTAGGACVIVESSYGDPLALISNAVINRQVGLGNWGQGGFSFGF